MGRLCRIVACTACAFSIGCAGVLPKSSADRQAEARAEVEAITARQRQADEQRRAQAEANAQAETQRIVDESRARREAQANSQFCRPTWRQSELDTARRARAKPKPAPGARPEGIPYAASERFKLFQRHAKTLEQQTAGGCVVTGREAFDIEWQFLQQQEMDRVAALQAREEKAAAERAEREAQRAAFEEQSTKQARKKGFEQVMFGGSVTQALQAMIEGAEPVSSLRRVAIEVGIADEDYTALQSFGAGQGLFTSTQTEIKLWVTAPGASIYEGTPLPSLVSEDMPFFVVTGTKSYRNAMGAQTQAFTVKPAW